jgi:hypothetical protein
MVTSVKETTRVWGYSRFYLSELALKEQEI